MSDTQPTPHITTYAGDEGLLTVTRNSLEADGELLIFETSYASLNDIFTKDQAEEIRREFLKRAITIRELTNRAYHEIYTDIQNFHEQVMNIRYINPKKLTIRVETLIYNDTVAIYEPKADGFCVEIRSPELAAQQRQLFEFVWKQGERPILGKNSRSSMF